MAPAARCVPERARHRETRLQEVLHGGLVTSALPDYFQNENKKELAGFSFPRRGQNGSLESRSSRGYSRVYTQQRQLVNFHGY